MDVAIQCDEEILQHCRCDERNIIIGKIVEGNIVFNDNYYFFVVVVCFEIKDSVIIQFLRTTEQVKVSKLPCEIVQLILLEKMKEFFLQTAKKPKGKCLTKYFRIAVSFRLIK